MNKIILIVVVLFAAIVGLGLFVDSQKPEAEPIDAATVGELVEQDYVSGQRDAAVVLFKYSDLQCPACAAFNPIVDQVKEVYKDNEDVAIVVRDFPLPFHRQANSAAYALRAAKAQGQFDAMQREIFQQQRVWSNNPQAINIFENIAEGLGLDMEQFRAVRDSDEVRSEVAIDYAKGRAIGVNSTPTFILQGEQIRPQSVEDFRQLIDVAIAEAATAPSEPEASQEAPVDSAEGEVSTTTDVQ